MSIPTAVNKSVIIGKETTFGTAATDSTGKILRRVSADINLVKNTFESNEIRTDYQIVDFRHGSRRVEGSIEGELSCATYELPFAALLRGSWASGVTTGTVITIAAADEGTFTRSAGSYVTDGFKVGDVIDVSGFTTAANNGRFLVSAVSATVLTVTATTLVDEVEGDSVTIAVAGKKLQVPSTGHTNDSFTIEQLYEMGATDVSELAVGCKFSTCSINVQPGGMTTVSFGVLGKDMDSDSTAYFQSPTAQTTTGVLAGPQGSILLDGAEIAVVTGYSVEIDGGAEVGEVVGSLTTPDIFVGPVRVSGQVTAYFLNDALWDAFKDEDELSLILRLDSAADETFAIKLPRIKLGGNTKDDPATGGIVQTIPFTALKYVGSGNVEGSTIVFQDSEL
jgi:hypothetical protein